MRGWLAVILVVVWVAWPAVSVGDESVQIAEVFPDTGQTVRGEFLEFFRSHGGVDLFGPPISAEFVDHGIRLQYFRNARLEWHPENPRPYRVQPGLLGDISFPREPPTGGSRIPAGDRDDERFYKETGHTVKAGFLVFFDRFGGVDTFGYPISELRVESNDRLVQWFQRARLDWQPDAATGYISLAPLGELEYRRSHVDTPGSP